MRALIIVDVQNDFRPDGPVPVAAADAVPRAINDYLDREPGYDHVVATQDYHINPGEHFSDRPDYSSSWPPHCVAGSSGADFHPDLDTRHIDAVFRKGAYGAAYSGFEGVDENQTSLLDWLRQRQVSEVDVVGVATDYCVRMTSEDAARAGFATRVLVNLTAGAAPSSTTAALEQMRSAGVTVVTASVMAVAKRDDLLAAVERSPQALTVHDRTAWVGLFTPDAPVEDPVGSSPHVGHDQIYRFYDTFIGPRDITFHRDLDIVNGLAVVRDLELEVAMGSAVTMFIPAFLRYDLRDVNGEWLVAGLRAYWELPAMMLQFLRTGTRAASPALQLSRGLLGNQGLRGTVGFMTGFRRAGTRHKKLVETFLNAVVRGDKHSALRALSHTATITLGDDDQLDLAELGEQLSGASWAKVIGAGSTVAVSVTSDHGRGVLFADVAWRANEINQIRYFPG